jgi:hypothetical protein
MVKRTRGLPRPQRIQVRGKHLQKERREVSEYTQTQEYTELMRYLVEELGVEHSEAEATLRDGDLFPFIDAGCMYPFEGEEAVRQWEDACEKLGQLHAFLMLFDYNPALVQAIHEAEERAGEQLRRLRERAGEASPEE